MRISFAFFFSILLFWTSCTSSNNQENNTEKETTTKKDFPELFEKVLTAHGGLDTWNAMNTVKFTRGIADKATSYIVDLKTRKERFEIKDKYVIGNDGEKVWVTPSRDSFPGKSPRFMKNLVFYFYAIPFVLADDGVNLTDTGEKNIDGKEYFTLKATFNDGVGDAPEDQYILFVNPETFRVEFINYSVTFYDASRATQYNALRYEWADVNGIIAPSNMIGYKWENDSFGEKRYETPISNISYSKEKEEDSVFAVPEGAWSE